MNCYVKVVYMPLNITVLIQSVNQDAIVVFKVYCLWQTLVQAVEATEFGGTLRYFWKGFNTLNPIQNIAAAR